MDWEQYRRWRAQWEARVASLPPRNGGFATPLQKSLGRAGRPFAQLVVEALDANRITAVDASRLLDLKYVHFDKLRAHLRHEPPDAIYMPDVCRELGIPCISMLGLMRREGWQF